MRKLVGSAKGGIPYKGIKMMTTRGVHEAVARVIQEHFDEKTLKKVHALDLASGQGALAQRIKDLGVAEVTAWELDIKQFRPKGIKVEAVDLNEDFSKRTAQKFDLITACEIAEHLENPYHFLRQIGKLLKPGGIAIVSTPNIESALSRLEFLIRGEFRWFDDKSYDEWGHVMPLSLWHLDKMLKNTDLELLAKTTNSPDYVVVGDSGWRGKIKGGIAASLYPLMRGNKNGDINIWIVKHV